MAEKTDVAIIGAGPAGLAVGACLRKAGLNFIILEKNDQLASSWPRHYERLHLHTVKQLSSLPYFPFPAAYPRYVPKKLIVEYLESYTANFDLKPRFGDAARSVCRDGKGWFIRGTSSSICAPFVVIASGFNSDPVIPSIRGKEKFRGTILHSSHYFNAEPFAGKAVLVVGMGNTGAEIALDLSEIGARTTISLRNGVHIVPRDLFGVPIQIVALIATSVLPRSAIDAVFPPILDWALGNPSKYGLKRPKDGILHRVASSGKLPVLDVGTVRKISEGAIKVLPEITELTEEGATFSDGSKGIFDAIIFATGYRPNYRSFLEADDLKDIGDAAPMRKYPNSTLYFVGFKVSVTGVLREISRQAVHDAGEIVRQRNELVR
jgi:hypothetical protein